MFAKHGDAMLRAVEKAIRAAWEAGRAEMDYLSGEEYAKETIEANEFEFTEEGLLYTSQRQVRA